MTVVYCVVCIDLTNLLLNLSTVYFVSFVTDSGSKQCLVSSLECLSSIVERISTVPTVVAPLGDSVVPRGPGSPQSSPVGIYEPL